MSGEPRRRAWGQGPRRRRDYRFDASILLEERQLLAPVLAVNNRTATIDTTTRVVTVGTGAANPASSAGTTTVALLTPLSDFGGDLVRIEGGPGGEFGRGVYAISRGAGSDATAVNRPGVIYRVDPATGQSSIFFDLNEVVRQLEVQRDSLVTNANASNSLGNSTGFVNWYDMTFDSEGYFDGRPSLFVSSVDRDNPNKNIIFQIGADGSLLGVFARFTEGQSASRFVSNPTAVWVAPPEQQSFLRGLLSGDGTGPDFRAFYFDANSYKPGQNLSTAILPRGVTRTALSFGPQTGITSSNRLYLSEAYATFTDLSTPSGGGA